ncbi:hypothetical protein APUTEX25_001043 [Auxenochlorella protothecoides]|uniref:Uncharacterized protein n=1 Tax=Auxenochlorella protothecoides TaxID=3075 RepID=A0A3M7KSU1_AUXPR|nr:hypothetical protein APUTEX25_001043 [Auxenochlorella protothecoides]|eukprot:RMZ52924.1 hypothetical protein APUTEX25_001043 [Auxenochlorella protothecoides]
MTDQETAPPAPSVPARPRLNLKPRDPEAVARMEAERQASIGKSPFGNAKPREAVIAGRVGKTEEEVLREEVKSTYKLHLRLSPSQLDEKKAQEAVIRQAEETAEAEEDAEKKAELNSEVAVQKEKLAELLGGFEGFPEYQQQAGHGARGGEYQEARQGRSQYQEPRQQGGADAATSFHRAPGAFVPARTQTPGPSPAPAHTLTRALCTADTGYTPPALSGRGVGGEINFEESYGAGQDRF